MSTVVYTAEKYARQIEQVTFNGEDVTDECIAIGIYEGNREGGLGWVDLYQRDTEDYIVSAGEESDPRPATVRHKGVIQIKWRVKRRKDGQETDREPRSEVAT